MNIRRIAPLFIVAVLVAAFLVTGSHAERKAQQPAQPDSGPGGAATVCNGVTAASFGSGGTQYWIFEPADPAPKTAPVIVFNHGWSGVDPDVYGAWIEHIVRRGNIVIYPRYQADLRTSPEEFTPNAVASVVDALRQLQSGNHVRPQLDHFAIVGHSAGGVVSANLAAIGTDSGLPQARAVMVVAPGKTWNRVRQIQIPLGDMSRIPAAALLLAVAGDADRIVRDVDARRIFEESTSVPASNKDLVIVQSDDHGDPALAANHFAPCGRGNVTHAAQKGGMPGKNLVDALEYYGYWKLFDGLCDAAFYGTNRQYALGNTPQQRFMGTWSDGTPVRELIVTDAP